MQQFLYLGFAGDFVYWRIVESDSETILRHRIRVLYRHVDLAEGCGQLVADEQGQTTESAVVFGFDTDL